MKRRMTVGLGVMLMLLSVSVPAATAAEVGPNDFRISEMGPDGNTSFGAINPDIAYNSQDDLYLVVWYGPDDTMGEFEVFGRLVDTDGTPLTAQFAISDMGPPNDPDYDAFNPAVAYNPVDNEFLVVWRGDDENPGDNLSDNDFEIFGQRLYGDTGLHKGANDFRISDVGPLGSTINGAGDHDVVHNSAANQYLVVWSANEGLGGLGNGEHEIYGQLLAGDTEVGTNDFRISTMGPDGDDTYDAFAPAAAYHPTRNEYLVTWSGDDDGPGLGEGQHEIFGQRLTAAGAAVGATPFRISDMGPDGSTDYGAFDPSAAYNPDTGGYLVAWEGDDDTATVDDEFEIFGQRLTDTGAEIGANDFRISDLGPNGDPSFSAVGPDVAHDPVSGGYLVVWSGEDLIGGSLESEVFGQYLTAFGTEIGANDFRISDMGPDGALDFSGFGGAVATGASHLVVWSGDDDTPPLVDDEYEVFGQLLADIGDTVGLVDVTQGRWYLRNALGAVTDFWYGNPGDLPVMGDWDGDGVATPGLYRQSDGFFYSRNSNSTGVADAECFAGNPEDVPIVGDWDGDGDDNLGIYRPSEQKFYVFTITCTGSPMGAAQREFLFGNPGDKPVAGDWDGDGIDEVGLHRESTGFFYWRDTLDTGVATDEIFFGDPGDRFVAGDWGTVDGTDTPAVFRPSSLTFYFRHTLTEGVADSQFGWAGAGSSWLPVSGGFGLD